MLSALRLLPQYTRAFTEAVREGGWRFATLRASGFFYGRIWPRVKTLAQKHDARTSRPIPPFQPFQEIIATLSPAVHRPPLLLIISNIQIKQCVHYRIQQKMRYLKLIGVQSMHISPEQPGRVRSFLGLAHTVIIYRTAIGPELLEDIIDSGAKILFEFDDLVVGPTALENSGILAQVSEQDALLLKTLSVEFLRTALNCHGIIVSSDYLAELYAKRENGLAEKPFYILPNFLETDIYREPGSKDFTFAYTSPSSSIRSELTMLSDFLARYDAVASRKWSILVMGNEKAMNELEKGNFRCGRVVGHPFAAFDDYLTAITKAETVLIPLADNDFNRSKTPIRLMDAAVSGTQALFSPVGSYTLIKEYLLNDSLCIDAQDWPKVGGTIAPALDALSENVIDLQQAVRQVYGVAAAESCYLRVFIDQIGLDPVYVSDRLTSR